MGWGHAFAGFVILGWATSLPELVTAIVAARKRETDLIIGNLLGSNIFNSLAVGAVLGIVGTGTLNDDKLTGLATIVMLVVVVVAAIFLVMGGKVVRWQAVVLLAIYLVTMPFTVSTNDDCDDSTTVECVDAVASSRG